MASNLSTIGFVFPDEEAFRTAMAACAADASKGLACEGGEYGIWHSPTGAEIWFHIGEIEGGAVEIFGLSPFFEGKSDVRVRVSRLIRRNSDNLFEGAVHAWVNPADTDGGTYPIVFDAVDFAARAACELPAVRRVRLAAFARQMRAFPDEAAFLDALSASGGVRLASRAFIPTGLFQPPAGPEGGESVAAAPQSTALLTGQVVDHAPLKNERTGREFCWLTVETLDAVLDVVADPEIVSGDIVTGGTIEATALMFGRFLD